MIKYDRCEKAVEKDTMENINCNIYFLDVEIARKKLFEVALLSAQYGRVLFILHEELDELPQLSQEYNSMNKHYMKMITFLYAKDLDSFIESISTLPDWKNIPATIILDNLSAYNDTNNLQNACGAVALLLDSVHSCSVVLKSPCKLHISVSKNVVNEEYFNTLQELYCVQNQHYITLD